MKPNANIRRFDVFATFNYVKNLHQGMPDAQAKGDAIWLAKVVASRGRGKPKNENKGTGNVRKPGDPAPVFKSLSGIPQTDEVFDKDIRNRMGAEYFDQVFLPKIREEYLAGRDYKEIRDCPHRKRGWCEDCAARLSAFAA